MKPLPFVINGRRMTTPDTVDVINPFDGSLAARISLAGSGDVALALDIAQQTFREVRHTPPSVRAGRLRKIAVEIARRGKEFTELLITEAGKPVTLAKAEVQRAQMTFELAAAAALEPDTHALAMDVTPAGAGHTGIVRRFPLGVILGITPFNFPLNLVAHKVAPCIATGNTMILKPALKTPLCALLLGEVLAECGVPAGQVTFLPFGHEHVPGLLRDPRIKMLSFTGGADAGWKLKAQAVRQKVTLELGGNAACVVEGDSDWKKHIPKMVSGAFGYAGQSCISVQRIFIHAGIYEEFRETFLAATRDKAAAGNPRDPHVITGPMITKDALEMTVQRIRDAVAAGAKLPTPLKTEGQILHPVVLEDVPRDAFLAREEAFAPVVALAPYDTFDGALDAVNDSRFGLQAGVFTNDENKIRQAHEVLDVGGVLVNQVPTFRVENMPYGGVKDSGCGREGVRYAMEDMTEMKTLIINTGGT